MSEGSTTYNQIQDKIWITSRVRMMAEKRVLRYNTWSLFLLTYYSLFTVVISVFDDYFMPIYTYFDGLAVSAAVAVLAASLIVSGFRFERTASLYRDCYLSLQRLYDDPGDGNSKQKPYGSLEIPPAFQQIVIQSRVCDLQGADDARAAWVLGFGRTVSAVELGRRPA